MQIGLCFLGGFACCAASGGLASVPEHVSSAIDAQSVWPALAERDALVRIAAMPAGNTFCDGLNHPR